MKKLNKSTATKTNALPIKVMQFGGGNFLRAFVDWMIEVLNDETDFNAGVVIIKPTERGDYQQLKDQNGYFNVILDGFKNGKFIAEKRLISCVKKIINPYTEWQSYLDLARNEDLRFVISNTTEAGIKFNTEDQVSDCPPREFPAKLTSWLYQRFKHFNGDVSKGCIFLPCELIENNGDALRAAILENSACWNLGDDFAAWIIESNYFCSTLVDRIVSGYPSDRAAAIQESLGYEDDLMVAGEYYHSWVISGPEIVQREMPFSQTDLNVEFVDNLVPYREMKVRVLNGAHTSMVPVAYLAGIRLVKEAMDSTVIEKFVESLLKEETLKTLDFSDEVKGKFANDVLDRFRNPLLKHQLMSISLNSTSKFVARLLPTLKDYLRMYNALPKRIVFAFSAMLRFYKGEFGGESIELKDEKVVLDFFKEVWTKHNSEELTLASTVVQILENTDLWSENLNELDGLADMVHTYLEDIESKGVENILKTIDN